MARGITIAAVARQFDDATVYREYAAQLAHGRRGAYARSSRSIGCSDEHVRNVVKRFEAAHPLLFPAQAPIAPQQPAHESTESLEYVSPPGGYPDPIAQPILRESAQYPSPQPIHILSTDPAKAAQIMPTFMPTPICWQRPEFKSASMWSPVANANAAANISYTVAVVLTVLLLPAMCRDARLLVCLPVLLWFWGFTGSCQRAMIPSSSSGNEGRAESCPG